MKILVQNPIKWAGHQAGGVRPSRADDRW
jgi:hypothetical protein